MLAVTSFKLACCKVACTQPANSGWVLGTRGHGGERNSRLDPARGQLGPFSEAICGCRSRGNGAPLSLPVDRSRRARDKLRVAAPSSTAVAASVLGGASSACSSSARCATPRRFSAYGPRRRAVHETRTVPREDKARRDPATLERPHRDMSLVGPRPEDPSFVALRRVDYERILHVRPGITGLSPGVRARKRDPRFRRSRRGLRSSAASSEGPDRSNLREASIDPYGSTHSRLDGDHCLLQEGRGGPSFDGVPRPAATSITARAGVGPSGRAQADGVVIS